MTPKIKLAATAFAALAVTGIANTAYSAYPDKPIRLVLGSAAGSGPDIVARLIADHLYGAWNQRVVVDPRPGVAGLLSAEIVTRSAADGYTWMMLTSQLFIATNAYTNHKVDLARDFASVSMVGSVPFVLVVHPQVPAKTVAELIDAAKKSQPPLRYGSSGTGGAEHLTAFLLGRMTGAPLQHVPYKGIGQAVADTAAREVHLTFAVVPVAAPMVQAGRVRALGVSSRRRAPSLPDVPSVAETVPGFETFGWYSIVVPTGTPRDIISKANGEIVKAVKDPQFGERLKGLGIEAAGTTVAEFDAFRADQAKRMSEIVKAAGVSLKQ